MPTNVSEKPPVAPGQPTSFRLSEVAREMLEELETHYGLKKTAVIEMLIRRDHRKELGGETPKKKRGKRPESD
jgi:hypothetical protein